jgi:hypothetical protein
MDLPGVGRESSRRDRCLFRALIAIVAAVDEVGADLAGVAFADPALAISAACIRFEIAVTEQERNASCPSCKAHLRRQRFEGRKSMVFAGEAEQAHARRIQRGVSAQVPCCGRR